MPIAQLVILMCFAFTMEALAHNNFNPTDAAGYAAVANPSYHTKDPLKQDTLALRFLFLDENTSRPIEGVEVSSSEFPTQLSNKNGLYICNLSPHQIPNHKILSVTKRGYAHLIVVRRPNTTGYVDTFFLASDRDDDNVPDKLDKCPDEKGNCAKRDDFSNFKVVPDSVRARHIMFRQNTFNAEKRIDAIKILIESGKYTFEYAAKQYSEDGVAAQGGDLGYFAEGRMVPEFNDMCFYEAEIGKIYKVQTQFGWHLVEVTDKIFLDAQYSISPDGYSVPLIKDPNTVKSDELIDGCPEPKLVRNKNMVHVNGGTFCSNCSANKSGCCGGEAKQRQLTVVKSFWMATTETTFNEYDAFCKATDRPKPNDQGWGRGKRPVINVNTEDAVAYCNWRSLQEGLTPYYTVTSKKTICNKQANGYRLPSSDEWKYAAHGGSRSKGYKYPGSNNLNEVAWIEANSKGKTHPVAQKKANELGIHDMSGNVAEWCWICTDYNEPVTDQNGAISFYIIKLNNFHGDSWNGNPSNDSFFQSGNLSKDRFDNVGFRICRTE
jgi:formylglycine-generating enzyme required for sulfatase activity